MKSPLLLLSLVLLGFSACQSDNKPATAAAGTELPRRRTPEGLAFTLATDQLFAPGEAKLTEQATTALDMLAAQLKKQEAKQFIIRCYTDDQGDDGQNLALTQQRVQAVASWLREHGIEAPAELQGMGEAGPVASNAQPEGQAQNRRLEVLVLE